MQARDLVLVLFLTATIPLSSHQHPPHQKSNHGRILQPMAFSRKIRENCHDRLLLLVCTKFCSVSLPGNTRTEVIRSLTNFSAQRATSFSIHARVNLSTDPRLRHQHPLFHNECAKVESHAEAFVVYIVAQRPFLYEFPNENTGLLKGYVENLPNWLSIFQFASKSAKAVNTSDLEKHLEDQHSDRLIVLLLYSNRCPYLDQAIANDSEISTRYWWSKVAESLADHSNQLTFLQLNIDADRETDGWNEIFLQRRLIDIDLSSPNCPRLILIKRKEAFLDYHLHSRTGKSNPNLYDNRTLQHLRTFIVDTLNGKHSSTEWLKLGEPLTDIEYSFHAQEYLANAKMMNQKFIAIGTTGGIGVIVLAISIFWGLKSSSYTGSVTQTAILALTEASPTMILATKNLKRTSSL